MAATIQIHEMSALDQGVDKTDQTVRFKKADNADVDLVDPIPIPAEGEELSYSKTLRSYMAAPPDTQVSNLRWYTGGTGFGEGVSVNVKNLGDTWAANQESALSDASDLFGYVLASPLDGDSVDEGPFDPTDDESYIGDLVRMQMAVGPTASPGTLGAKSLTHAYDEI